MPAVLARKAPQLRVFSRFDICFYRPTRDGERVYEEAGRQAPAVGAAVSRLPAATISSPWCSTDRQRAKIFHEQYSDVNLLLVLRQLGASALHSIAPVITWWTPEENLRPPMIMTHQELQESADVFAIELLDIKLSHRTLAGEDVVMAIEVPMNLHRVEVEHELRTTLLRLRQHLLLGPGEDR